MKKQNIQDKEKLEQAENFILACFDNTHVDINYNIFKRLNSSDILKLDKVLKNIHRNSIIPKNSFTSSELERQDFVDNSIHKLLMELSGNEQLQWDIQYISIVRMAVQKVICDMLKLEHPDNFYPYFEIPNEHKIICSIPNWAVKPILWLTSFSKEENWIITCMGYDEDLEKSTQLDWKEDKYTTLDTLQDFLLCKKR